MLFRSSWIAYVPPGSLERGRVLVTTGGAHLDGGTMVDGHTMACGKCHGPSLLGMDDAPPIAGRSPSYLARQIYDIQQGARMGPNAAMMRPVVANLTPDDIVAITAYIGSLAPSPGVTPTPPELGPRRVTATAHR